MRGSDMTSLNLLRFPTLQRQQQSRQMWQLIGVGLVLGSMAAAGVLSVLSVHTDRLEVQTQRLQKQLAERKRWAQTQQEQQIQQQRISHQMAQLSQLQSQQEAWLLLQQGLLELIPGQGVHLQRLQVEAGRMDLQGHASHVQAMNLVAQKLAERWGIGVHLQTLESDGAAMGASAVSFAWQSQWPALGAGAGLSGKAKP